VVAGNLKLREQEARQAEAERWARASCEEAEGAFRAADSLHTIEDARFVLPPDFSRAIDQLEYAQDAAERAVDGRFTALTAVALRRYQRRHGLVPDGIAGLRTYRMLARRGLVQLHVVQPGESFFSIAARYRVSP
jgi:murein L,D-transpeptidase YcbB/YkuD